MRVVQCIVTRTVVNCPPERICVIDFAMEGFSATQSTRVGRIECVEACLTDEERRRQQRKARQRAGGAQMESSRAVKVTERGADRTPARRVEHTHVTMSFQRRAYATGARARKAVFVNRSERPQRRTVLATLHSSRYPLLLLPCCPLRSSKPSSCGACLHERLTRFRYASV